MDNAIVIYNANHKKPVFWTDINKWLDANGFTAALSKGTTAKRPTGLITVDNVTSGVLVADDIGFEYFDTTLNKKIYAKSINNTTTGNVIWIDEEGVDLTGVTSIRGATTTRVAMPLTSANSGLKYYDTTLNKYVLWNGTAWTNLDGTSLS